MIDGDKIRELVMKRIPFTIGTRGICIKCIPHPPEIRGWTIMIPRAFVEMDVEDIDVLDDVDYYHLTYRLEKSAYGEYHSLADLTQYDKLTIREWRVNE